MFSRPAESLRGQLLRWLLVPLLALLVVNAWFSNEAAIATANQAFDRLLLASADAIAEDVEERDGKIVVDLPYAALQLLESNIQERIFYRVVAPGGATITGYADLPLPAARPLPGAESVLYTALYHDEPIHLVALDKQVYGAARGGPIVIIVAETGEARQALSHRILIDGLLRQGLLIVAAAVLVWFGLLRSLRPLTLLREALLARSPADLSPVDARTVPVEVRTLIDALNQHTARIERLQSGRRRLIADASHQMRTPLAEMRTQIEYVLRQDRPELLRRTLVDVHADIDRLSRLISQMLLQARADPDVWPDQRIEVIDLAELARSTSLDFVAAARKRSIDLGFETRGGSALVAGHGLLLRELVANLIDNAITHGRDGGSVVVRVSGGHAVTLEVEDDGVGIAPDDRDKVFDRFYRGTDLGSTGSGLGLSIVRDLCTSHRASIELRTPVSGRGLCVSVTFAAAAAAVAALPASSPT